MSRRGRAVCPSVVWPSEGPAGERDWLSSCLWRYWDWELVIVVVMSRKLYPLGAKGSNCIVSFLVRMGRNHDLTGLASREHRERVTKIGCCQTVYGEGLPAIAEVPDVLCGIGAGYRRRGKLPLDDYWYHYGPGEKRY